MAPSSMWWRRVALFSFSFPLISPVFILPCFSFIFSDCILESDLALTKSWLAGQGWGWGGYLNWLSLFLKGVVSQASGCTQMPHWVCKYLYVAILIPSFQRQRIFLVSLAHRVRMCRFIVVWDVLNIRRHCVVCGKWRSCTRVIEVIATEIWQLLAVSCHRPTIQLIHFPPSP